MQGRCDAQLLEVLGVKGNQEGPIDALPVKSLNVILKVHSNQKVNHLRGRGGGRGDKVNSESSHSFPGTLAPIQPLCIMRLGEWS